MHRSQAICLACRRQPASVSPLLSNSRSSQLFQWQERSSSSPASASPRRIKSSSAYDFVPASNERQSDDARSSRPNRGSTSTTSAKRYHRRFQVGSISKNDQRQSGSIVQFRDTLQQHADQDVSLAEQQSHVSSGNVEFFNKVEQLRSMKEEESLHRCYQFFWDEIWCRPEYKPLVRRSSQPWAIDLLQKVVEEKAEDMYSGKWPSMAQVTQIALELNSKSSNMVSSMVLKLVDSILSSNSMQIDRAKKEELLEDLVETWILFSRQGLNPDSSSLLTSSEAQFRLPEFNGTHLRKNIYRDKDNLGFALGLVFGPAFPASDANVQAAILATFVLLVDANHSNAAIRERAKPFLISVGRFVATFPLKLSQLAKIFQSHPRLFGHVSEIWPSIVSQLKRMIPTSGSATTDIGNRIVNGEFGEDVAIDPKQFKQRLSRALLLGDIKSVESTWARFWGENDEPDQKRAAEMQSCLSVFNAFIGAFTALGCPQKALDAWGAMNRVGINATIETWTAMLDGFRKARNPAGLEGVWKKLIASRLELTEEVWRTRIAGLMDSREPQSGLQALNELAEQSKRPGGVPLTIESVNAVITGLIRLNAMTAVQDVLQWASKRGVSPDVFTYNPILRHLLREGNAAQAESVLHLMQAQGVRPDSATFTALLDGILVSSRDKSEQETVLMLSEFMKNMGEAGVTVTADMLGRIIHLFIKDGHHIIHHTQGIVEFILKYGERKNIRLSRHIYTMLIEHYFSQTPPALDDINELIVDPRGLLLSATGSFDRVFWERLIQGYALAGDVDRAFGLFRQINSLGTGLTLECLEALLRGLVSRGNIEEARELVTTVTQARAYSKQHRRDAKRPDRYLRHGFWGFAVDCNLISRKEIEAMQNAATPASAAI